MVKAFHALFAFLTTLFTTADNFAKAGEMVSEYTLEGAQGFRDEARLERSDKLLELTKKLDEKGLTS